MTMTPEEICRDYRTAKSRLKQIGILAELNQCSKDKIKQILIDGGEKLPGNMTAPGQKRERPAAKPEPVKAPVSRADFQTDLRSQAIELIRKAVEEKCDGFDFPSAGAIVVKIRGILEMLDTIERM